MSTELLYLLLSVYFALWANQVFWEKFLEAAGLSLTAAPRVTVGLFVVLVGVHWLLMLCFVPRILAKPVGISLLIVTPFAVYFMREFGVYFDKSMLRNVVETDTREARELLGNIILWLQVCLYGVVPAAVFALWPQSPARGTALALFHRAGWAVACVVIVGLAMWSISAIAVPVFRDKRELRYLVTPANYLVSVARVLGEQTYEPEVLEPIASDAIRGEAASNRRPRVFVVIVGETVRAANWGLNGYRRQTTPQLQRRDVYNFPDVESCGTSTAVSLPCMFSLSGRRQHDEAVIRRSESVLHVLQRTGVDTLWRDNQSGCKGVCRGLPFESMASLGACPAGLCYDESLLDGLVDRIGSSQRDFVVVLHMMGNHGPRYYLRYPPAFQRWAPVCTTANLAQCSRESIVNAYDNGVAYADHVVARAIDMLVNLDSHDAGLLFVSDHGESLGENNVYLHGLPHLIAPAFQKKVPQVLWLSPALKKSLNVDMACLDGISRQPTSHDSLSHLLLGMMNIKTERYEPSLDFLGGCSKR
ncbi:phosphoethanolamine transferase [Pigmentiphaga kullae]|uniref:phosphoethanolamine transferase n=1 Tax=Pigmentiphaga kullae TaxID=151784 RepID=UPI0013EE8FCB|nr:phosphoethanolamine--lipid A transferase [Pigmentiphaga kullae]